MSDAFTDMERDKKLFNKEKEIKNLEEKFFNIPSIEKANNLLEECNKYASMKRGFSRSPNLVYTSEMKKFLEKYINHKNS